MGKKRLITAFFFLLLPVFLRTQNGLPYQGVFKYSFLKLQYVPPLNSGMPLPVLAGYVYIDSFARNVSEDSLRIFLNSLTYSDKSRQALSLLYTLDDFDPIRWFQYTVSDPIGARYKTAPIFLTHNFGRHISKEYPDSGRSAILFYSDYILDILVSDTIMHNDAISAISKKIIGVTASALDTIKGRVLPNCSSGYIPSVKGGSKTPTTLSSCIQFEYRPNRIRIPKGNSLVNLDSLTVWKDGSSWVKPNTEYIVFLLYNDLRRTDSLYNYASLEPVYAYSTCASMYPVINGIVYDPNDDFGFGVNLTPQQFKTALRNKIQRLLNSN